MSTNSIEDVAAAEVKKLRTEAKLSPQNLATEAGVTRMTVTNIESRAGKGCNTSTLGKVLGVFGLGLAIIRVGKSRV